MLIGNVYRPEFFGCQADERLPEVARRMLEADVGSLAVLDGEWVTGIITEHDLTRALAAEAEPSSEQAGSYASTQVKTAALDEDSRDVARRMIEEGIRHLPVAEHRRLVGMVSMRDLLALETWTP